LETKVAEQDPLLIRRRFGAYLSGEGIELGPGHVPFPVSERASVRYVDRWEPEVNTLLFPELGATPGFPKPDVIANLDQDRLSMFDDCSQDFIIASHIIEHLANPLSMLEDCHRILRTGGRLILLVPNRHATFDRDRAPTPLAHVVDEYRRDVREVDDAHILDFLVGTRKTLGDDRDLAQFNPGDMAEEILLHGRRSVHAHVWNVDEFRTLLEYTAYQLGLRWHIIDNMPPGAPGSHGDEFGWVLSRASTRRWRLPWRRGYLIDRPPDLGTQ
jgi:SAM-dependent methyltransferase